MASLLTLLGNALVEHIRRELPKAFKLTPKKQAQLAMLVFWTFTSGAIIVIWARYGMQPLVPTTILLGTAAWHLHQGYVPALLSDGAGTSPRGWGEALQF